MNTLIQCGDGDIYSTGKRSEIGFNLAHLIFWYWTDDSTALSLAMSNGEFIVLKGEQADNVFRWLQEHKDNRE